jgi:hypothetical protein
LSFAISTPGQRPQIHFGDMRAAAVAARTMPRSRFLILRSAPGASAPARDSGRSDFGPMMTKSLYLTGSAHAVALAEELFLGGFRMHEHDVGIAARARSSAWPVPSATTRTSMRLLLEERQEMLEEPGLLGRRRRGNRDEPLRERARRAGEGECEIGDPHELVLSSMATLL